MNERLTSAQFSPGSAARWALKLPTAPFHLPRIPTDVQRFCARASRATKLATSLPRVVGLAGCPCVRASIAMSAYRWASSRKPEIRASSVCSSTSRAPFSIFA